MADSEAKCPFHQSKPSFTVQFEEPPPQTWWRAVSNTVTGFVSRFSISSLKNAWDVYKIGDFNVIFKKIYHSKDPVVDFPTPMGPQYVTRDPDMLQLVLSKYRNEENGLFHVPENKRLFVDDIIKEIYPDELTKITDMEMEVINAIVFTAESAHVPALRSQVMAMLKQKVVLENRDELDKIARDIFTELSEEEKSECIPAMLVFEFAITVIAKIFVGYQTTRENYQKVVRALVEISKHISDGILHKPPTEQEKVKYEAALKIMRELIDENIRSEPTTGIIPVMKENGFSEFATKIYLFFFYLAGTETTAAATHYLFLELGKEENWHFQYLIRDEGRDSITLKKCVAEALRLNPPVFIIGRAMRKDMLLTKRDTASNAIVWSKLLRKDSYIVNWIGGAGRNPEIYADPDKFDPNRFDTIPTQFPWFPFASGHHTCPGQFLAKAEMESFIYESIKHFNFQNVPAEAEIESKATFTQHADPDGKIGSRLSSM